MKLVLYMLFLILLVSCTKESTVDRISESPMSWVEEIEIENGTQGMVDLLDTIKVFYEVNNWNLFTMQSFTKKSKRKVPQELLDLYYGETEKVIESLEQSYHKFSQLPPEESQKYLHLLGIAYFRLAEQENCIHHHNAESCIIPIKKNGQHTKKEGALKAIEIYKEVLSNQTDDLTAKYLLNLAYMVLGQYPNDVPKEYLVPLSLEQEEDENIKAFEDIATKLDLDVNSLSGGSVIEDFNNDGFLDIAVSGWSLNDQMRIFFNDGKEGFIDVTEKSGLKGITGGLNMICADYDNDGFRDILVLRGAWRRSFGKIPNSLLKNNGDGTFTDVTQLAGILSFAPTQTAAFADFNNDGWLDLFIGNESRGDSTSFFACEFYINNKNGTFTNQTAEQNLEIYQFVKSVAVGDFNNDGWQDLYISSLRDKNLLFQNNGLSKENKLSFTEVAEKSNVGNAKNSFVSWFWDYNNDGHLDLFVSGYIIRQGNMSSDILKYYMGEEVLVSNSFVYENNGDGTFSDKTRASGMNIPTHAMGANFGDINNDGFPDIYLGTGEPDFRSIVPNRMFLNESGESFKDITTEAAVGHIQKGHGIAFGDLDNDGSQEILAELGGAAKGDAFRNALFHNPGYNNKWIYIVLEGERSNKDGIGTRIKIWVENEERKDVAIHKLVSSGGSFGSNSLQQEIGLGKAKRIKSIEVFWPSSNTKQIFNNVETNQRITIKEGLDEIIKTPMKRIYFREKTKKQCH